MQLVSGAELPSPLRLLQVLENLIETSAMFFNHLNIIKFFFTGEATSTDYYYVRLYIL